MGALDELRTRVRAAHHAHRARPELIRGLRVPYTRRGVLSIPGLKVPPGGDPETDGRAHSLRLMRKAAELPVDFFFFDLEDAAPDNAALKPLARRFVIEALQTLDFGDRVVAYRPNNIRTPHFEDDLVEVVSAAGHRLHAIVIPKTEFADEVRDIAGIVRDLQRLAGHTNPVHLEVLIESPRAFLEAERIASIDEVSALAFGAWDFARTVGGRVTPERWLQELATVRQTLPVVAAACGKDAVDAVTATLPVRPRRPDGVAEAEFAAALSAQPETLDRARFGDRCVDALGARARAIALARRDAEDARACGFAGKWILHPDQIDAIQGAWNPSREEALSALRRAADYTRAAHEGSGAELHGNQLTDKAVVGAEWWLVRAGLACGALDAADVDATGFTLDALRRTVVTHDGHATLT